MSESNLPLYVDARYDPSCPIPGLLQSTQLYVAYTQGKTRALQVLVDTFLNGPCGGAYFFFPLGVPLVGNTVLPLVIDQAFLTSGGMSMSGYPPQPDPSPLGWARYAETAFVVPVWVVDGTSKLPANIPRLQFFMPYVWVTAAPGMATGREAWGYRKTMSDISFPHPVQGHVVNFEVSTLSQLGSAPQSQTVTPLIRGHLPTPQLFYDVDNDWQKLAEKALDDLARALCGPRASNTVLPRPDDHTHTIDVRKELSTSASPLSVTAINLKQFRDCADGNRACYQALVASPISVRGLQALGTIDAAEVRMGVNTDSGTYDIGGDLGLSNPGSLEFFGAGYAQLDMGADPGTVIWQWTA